MVSLRLKLIVVIAVASIMFSSVASLASRSARIRWNSIRSTTKSFRSNSFVLEARRKKPTYDNIENIEDLIPKDDPGWVTISIGSEEDEQKADMMDRIQEAKDWESTLGGLVTGNKISKKANRRIDLGDDIEDLIEDETAPKKSKTSKTGKEKGKNQVVKNHVDDYLANGDESSKRISGYLELNPFVCSGCGTNFQSKTDDAPGYLPADKFKEHREKAEFIRKKQEAIKTLNMAGIELNSSAAAEMLRAAQVDETIIASIKVFGDRLLQDGESISTESVGPKDVATSSPSLLDASLLLNNLSANDNQNSFEFASKSIVNKESIANMLSGRSRQKLSAAVTESSKTSQAMKRETKTLIGPDGEENEVLVKDEEEEICICQRCYRLQQYGQVEQSLRPGWSKHEFLTPERFETLLSSISKSESVVLCLVDIFDLQGSIVRNLRQIAGDNPVLIGVNKVDLLPKDISKIRVQQWVHEEIKRICGFVGPKNREDEKFISASAKNVLKMTNIHLISCKNDAGVRDLMSSALTLAEENGRKIHVMGAANVGKSSFINRLLDPNSSSHQKKAKSSSSTQQHRKKTPLVTVSNLPGTTLDFLKIKLPNSGITVVDTPGLINRGHLTSKLTTDELRQVIPSKPINAVTFRLEEGKCALLGGFARVELAEGRPFFFTFYVSNEIKLHITDQSRADSFLTTHIGKLIFPPANLERLEAIGPFVETIVEVEGDSWQKAAADIVIPGLGWITVTGPGIARVKITSTEGTEISVRPPLLPFEAKHTTASYTGGRISKRSSKSGAKAYGWRA